MLQVGNLPEINQIQTKKTNTANTTNKMKLKNEQDLFKKTNKKEDKSSNGKFDISECAKSFAKGIFSPLTAIIKHPIATIGVVAATAAACTLVPVLGPIMAVGFGALSAFQIGKGVVDVVQNYKQGEYDKAEKSFETVGQGTIGVAMTALGLKQGAKVAKEAKMMSELGVTSLNKAQKAEIALEIKNGTHFNALKEIGSLFTSKAGLKAVGTQFIPSNIAARGKEALKFLFSKEEVTKLKTEKKKFAETAEGKRRAAMTSEEIEAEIRALYKESCDEYGIPEELRPKLKITNENANRGGSYSSVNHQLTINENSYREGIFDLPDIIKHETTHANEAILRQRLSQDQKEQLAIEYLLDKIKNGDKENILTGRGNILTGNETINPPKMNAQMKNAFSKLAQDKLYQMSSYTDDEFVAMVKPLVEGNPEFVQGFNNTDDAINAMANYAKSHNYRYQIAIRHSSGFDTSNVDTSLLKELSQEEKLAAIKSFKENIDCIESNCANNTGCIGIGGDFNQYQFTPEEVLAQQKGNNFEISKLETKLAQLKSQQNYDLAEEARLLDQIEKAKLTIEYKTKGQQMYRLYTESINHPENTQLANQVKGMQAELSDIQSKINSISSLCNDNAFGTDPYVLAKEYTTYQANVRPEMGASHNIPLTTTTAANIIADDIKADKI